VCSFLQLLGAAPLPISAKHFICFPGCFEVRIALVITSISGALFLVSHCFPQDICLTCLQELAGQGAREREGSDHPWAFRAGGVHLSLQIDKAPTANKIALYPKATPLPKEAQSSSAAVRTAQEAYDADRSRKDARSANKTLTEKTNDTVSEKPSQKSSPRSTRRNRS
jgi:hypothetical protein